MNGLLASWIFIMLGSGVLIIFAWRAFVTEQPYHVLRTFAIVGFVTLILYIAAFPVIFRDYRKAEQQRGRDDGPVNQT